MIKIPVSLGSMFVSIGAKTGALKAGLLSASGMIGKFGGIAKLGMLGVVSAVTAVGVGAGVMAVKSVKAFSSVEEGYAKVNTLLDEGQDSMAIYGGWVDKANVAMGHHGDQLAVLEGLYQTQSAGITDATEAMEFMDAAILTTVGGTAELDTVILAGTKVLAAFGDEAGSAEDIMDRFAAAVKTGQIIMPELSTSLPKVSGLWAEMGGEINELIGVTSGLTKVMQNADAATTGISAILTKVLNPTTAMEDAVAALGYESAATMFEQEGFMKSLGMLKEHVNGDAAAFAELFGNVRAIRTALPALGKANDSVTESILAQSNATGLARKQYEDMAATTAFSFGKMKSTFENFAVEIGGELIPILQPLVEILGDILPKAMEFMKPIIIGMTERFTTLATFLFERVLPAFEPLIPVLLELSDMIFDAGMQILDALMPAIIEIVPLVTELIEVLMPLIPPLIDIAVMIIDIAVAIVKELVPGISSMISFLEKWIEPIKSVVDWLANLIAILGDALYWIGKFIGTGIGAIFEGLSGATDWLFGGSEPAVSTASVPASTSSGAFGGGSGGSTKTINQDINIYPQQVGETDAEISQSLKRVGD